MPRKVTATTANVLVCFQTRPGVDQDSIIEAGQAIVTSGVETTTINPQGSNKKGFYGLKLSEGATAELTLFNTKYKIKRETERVLENKPDKFCITCWKSLGSKSGLHGKQRRLQMLGYYTGKVDNIYAESTERATLNFQADNQLRTDGKNGDASTDKTKDKLHDIIKDDKDQGGNYYIACRTLIKFIRAPIQDDPDKTDGPPSNEAPDIDDRGFVKVKTYNHDLHGPTVTMMSEGKVRIKVIRECIGDSAKLIAVSSDETVVKVLTPNLPNKSNMILKLEAKKITGNDEKKATVSIKYKKGDTEIKIGSIEVIVLPKINVKVRPVWVKINGKEPTDNRGTGQTFYSEVFKVCNKIWHHYGVYFEFLGWKYKNVNGFKTAGELSKTKLNPADANETPSYVHEFKKIWDAAYTDATSTDKNVLNIIIVRDIPDAYGLTWSTLRFTQEPYGIVLTKHGNHKTKTGIDMAHEFGHFLGLANNFDGKRFSHSEDDPNSQNKKKDLWSARRVMYGEYIWQKRGSDAWVKNLGYGDKICGCVVSVRDLPKGNTDNELYNGRKRTESDKFYAN